MEWKQAKTGNTLAQLSCIRNKPLREWCCPAGDLQMELEQEFCPLCVFATEERRGKKRGKPVGCPRAAVEAGRVLGSMWLAGSLPPPSPSLPLSLPCLCERRRPPQTGDVQLRGPLKPRSERFRCSSVQVFRGVSGETQGPKTPRPN